MSFVLGWIKLEQQIMLLLGAVFVTLVAWAVLDEDFSYWITWTSESYEYQNKVTFDCEAGPCRTVFWSAKDAPNPAAFAVTIQGVRLTAAELSNPARLTQVGFQRLPLASETHESLRRQVVAQGLKDPGPFTGRDGAVDYKLTSPEDPNLIIAWLSLDEGRLQSVRVHARGDATVQIEADGQALTLPIRRAQLRRAWGQPVRIGRHHAINGTMPDK